MTDKWDTWFMGLAAYVATASKDPSTKMGAVVVAINDRRKIAFGYNGIPPGLADAPERLNDRATKYSLTLHAETNALDNATFDLRGATLYCVAHPCLRCALSIISRRVARVVCPPLPPIEPDRWTAEIPEAQRVLAEAGVRVDVVEPERPTVAPVVVLRDSQVLDYGICTGCGKPIMDALNAWTDDGSRYWHRSCWCVRGPSRAS